MGITALLSAPMARELEAQLREQALKPYISQQCSLYQMPNPDDAFRPCFTASQRTSPQTNHRIT